GIAVGGVQHAAQRVAARGLAGALGGSQQVQVVVAEQAAQRAVVGSATAQYGGGIGAPVDEVAQQIDGVAAGRESDFVQQAAQRGVAALDIANTVECHGALLLIRWSMGSRLSRRIKP